MNNIFMKKAGILAITVVTALCMSACGDTSKDNESKKADTSSVAAKADTAEESSATETEEKADTESKAEEKTDGAAAEIINSTGIGLTMIELIDSGEQYVVDLIKQGDVLPADGKKSFDITSGKNVLVKFTTEDGLVFEIPDVNTSDIVSAELKLNGNVAILEYKTKDGETRSVMSQSDDNIDTEADANEYTEPDYTDYTEDYTDYNDYSDDYNDYNEDYNDYTDNNNYEEPAQDNTDQGGCISEDTFTF